MKGSDGFLHTARLVRPQILLIQQLEAQSMDRKVSSKPAMMPRFTLQRRMCCLCLICPIIDSKKPKTNPKQKKSHPQNKHRGRDLPCLTWHYPAMEQITGLTFKTLHWLLMTTRKNIISNSRHHLLIQQTSTNPREVAQLKLNCADQQVLEEDTFLLNPFDYLYLVRASASLKLPTAQKTITNPVAVEHWQQSPTVTKWPLFKFEVSQRCWGFFHKATLSLF